MLEFLNEVQVAKKFKAISKLKGEDRRLAVAFWGQGALEALGLTGKGQRESALSVTLNLVPRTCCDYRTATTKSSC